jgi:hypothetical protein
MGPPPKNPATRARRNKSQGRDFRVVTVQPCAQPALTKVFGGTNPATRKPWRAFTKRLWESLAEHPATQNHTLAQWLTLANAVALEEAGVLGIGSPSEGRLRMSKHFIDPDDMMRGRILTVQVEQAEAEGAKPKPVKAKPGAKKRVDPRANLSVVS